MYRALFDAAPTPFLVLRPPDWTILAANDARLRITGTTREEQIGRNLFDQFPDDPDDPDADGVRNLAASLGRVLATREADVMPVQRYALRDAEGRFVERWWSPVNTPVLGDDGEVTLVIHRVEEVTELLRLRGEAEARDQLARDQQAVIDRERAAAAALRESQEGNRSLIGKLRASEEFTRRILASSADCIKVMDLNARLEFMSEGGMCVMEIDDFGAVEGACWPDFWKGEEHAMAVAAVEEARRGGTGRFQGFATTFKESPRWWDVIVTAMSGPDGKPEKLLSISRDVTSNKEAEVRLRELNDTLEQQVAERTAERDRMWDTSPDLMVVIDFGGVFRRVNPAWTTLLGYSPEELVGHHVNAFVVPDDHVATVCAYELAADGGSPAVENHYRHRDGSVRTISWVAAPANGLVYATGRDVTAERAAADELAQAQEALRQAQKMEAVGQLTGGLAHDFNNLLTGIMGNLELLQLRIARGRLDDVDRFVTAAQGAGRRAASLTQRLLAFSRRQTLDPKPTDVNRLIAGMEELIRRTVGPTTDIRVVGAAGLWTAMIDAGQLENALLNLCINARDAMPDGGTITVETANKWLDERTARQRDLAPGQYLSICVTDTGTGMTPETIERAFEPFFTTKPLGQGTGLGLSMIYGFARQSGGQVRIYSELGQGTTMCVYLPRFRGDAPSDETNDLVVHDLASRGETVLVVDDEATIRHLIDEVLNDLGYAVIGAADGAAGLKVIQSGARIDLLITDVGLPNGMNGRQVADAARAIVPDLKVLFITGYAENAAVGNGHLDPGMELLTKPFALDDLTRKVSDMLGQTSPRGDR
jgi:PAS domain S-box-containing protein